MYLIALNVLYQDVNASLYSGLYDILSENHTGLVENFVQPQSVA